MRSSTCTRCFLATSLLALSFLSVQADETRLVTYWKFQSEWFTNGVLRAAAGNMGGTLQPGARLVTQDSLQYLELDGKAGSLQVSEVPNSQVLPSSRISVEAWVRLDQIQTWGGIINVIQDNGTQEEGWILGFQNDRFLFGLATGNPSELSFLTSDTSIQTGAWYHVVGTYDSQEQRLYVNGNLEKLTRKPSGAIRYPARKHYEIGAYRDDNEFYPMHGAIHSISIHETMLTGDEIRQRFESFQNHFQTPDPNTTSWAILDGPFIRWTSPSSVSLTWEANLPSPTHLQWFHPNGQLVREFTQTEASTRHEISLTDLEPNLEYRYQVIGRNSSGVAQSSEAFLFDSSFYYFLPSKPAESLTASDDNTFYQLIAQQILSDTGISQGYCLILGAGDGRLALEIARQSDLQVVVLEPDSSKVQQARHLIDTAGYYGPRVSVHQGELSAMPYGPYFANLILSESLITRNEKPDIAFKDLYSRLRPYGGVAYLGHSEILENHLGRGGPKAADTAVPLKSASTEWENWIETPSDATLQWSRRQGNWAILQRQALPGAGQWSHQYGSADNSSCSYDELVQGELEVLWWGDPGPRPMPDRGNRNPAPLSTNGRLFIQGDRVLFGLDAYNGSMLWTLFNPQMRRANMVRDCSNMAASDNTLFLAQGPYCHALDAQTGDRLRRFQIPDFTGREETSWGFVATVEDMLIGSRVKSLAQYLGDDGEWYENYATNEVGRVTSDVLFGFRSQEGKALWNYRGGAILNSTLTIADGVIYFIESRDPRAIQHPSGRIPNEYLGDQHLVALDLHSGTLAWDRPLQSDAFQYMTYLAYGNGTLVVTGTDKDKHFHNMAFHAKTVSMVQATDTQTVQIPGTLLWSESHKEDKGHHSGHLQHPLIIDDVFYSDQRAFHLKTGELLRKDLPERRGCGTMSAGRKAVFFRHYFHSMWDLESDTRNQFEGIRTGCWLGLIPAGGLLLAPESSAGCSCTHSIQASIAYVPKIR